MTSLFAEMLPPPPVDGLPLAGLRVIDLTTGRLAGAGQLLAQLGAEVVLVEAPGGAESRHEGIVVDGESVTFATHNTNKRSIVVDTSDAAHMVGLGRLIGGADVLIESALVAADESPLVDVRSLHAQHPSLVIASISPFGMAGSPDPVTDGELLAMAGVLARSGVAGGPPVLVPGAIAFESVAVHTAWCVLVAVWNRANNGCGDLLDISLFEATAQLVDPAFGVAGSAASGAAGPPPRGRPDVAHYYPVFACADGLVRIAMLSPAQWRAMRSWLGEPTDLMDPGLDVMAARFAAASLIHGKIAELFAGMSAAAIVAEARRRAIPAAEVGTLAAVLAPGHSLGSRLVEFETPAGRRIRTTAGPLRVDGAAGCARAPAPVPGADGTAACATWSGERIAFPTPAPAGPARYRPLEGVRILDLGVIVLGAEIGRLFADQGADVIKVENQSHPDGLRQNAHGSTFSPSFARGHRNKLGLGLNLRHADGANIFERLVAQSDAVLANFKPGTLESLGFSAEQMLGINPRIVVAESSAFGSSGTDKGRMGYGPLVRAETGFTDRWRRPDRPAEFGDASTVFPDHLAGRVAACGVLALLLRRRSSGRGGLVTVAQTDVALNVFQDEIAAWSLGEPIDAGVPSDALARWLVACAGDDEWCVVSARHRGDLASLAALLGIASDVDSVEPALSTWAAGIEPLAVEVALRRAGVPAAYMRRPHELLDDPHLLDSEFFRDLVVDGAAAPLPFETAPCHSVHLADPGSEPAPRLGEHTDVILQRVLGIEDAELERLAGSGAIERAAQEHDAH